MTREFFLYPVSPTTAARIPFPDTLALDARAAYMARPPRDAIAQAEVVPHDGAGSIAPDISEETD